MQQVVAVLDVSTHDRRAQIEEILEKDKVSISEYIEFIGWWQQETKDEMLGLLDRPVPLGSFAVLCEMLIHSPDVLSALRHYVSFYGLFSENAPLIVEQNQTLDIVIHPESRAAQFPYYVHTMLLGVLKLLCWLTGQKVTPESVSLSLIDTKAQSEYEYLFGVAPALCASDNRLSLPLISLGLPIAPKIPVEEYTQHRSTYLLIWAVAEDLERKVYSMVAEGIANGHFNVETLAQHLHVSRHTLNRRLAEAGTTYREILSRVRRDQATLRLRESNQSLGQVAESLGYSDARAFSRAFTQWLGESPAKYRSRYKL